MPACWAAPVRIGATPFPCMPSCDSRFYSAAHFHPSPHSVGANRQKIRVLPT
jgi:chemotaxis response regulator CheB